jgi:hypothetical protein
MSQMSELSLEIEMMLEKGDHPSTISAVLDCPVSFVYDVLEEIQDSQFDELNPFNTVNS